MRRAAKPPEKLTPSSVYVRIRPVTQTGDCGHTDGEAVSKQLVSWDRASVKMRDSDRNDTTRYRYTGVIPPEMEQEEAFNAMLPNMLTDFQANNRNVLFFAYGQTGSGKTHTILGETESLASVEPAPGWGIFPRVVHSTLQLMQQWREAGVRSVLVASAVEFYCGAAFDLSSAASIKSEVTIDREANVFGARSKEITSTAQLKRWITKMYRHRTTAKTNMNDASSRSHCAFILTLHKLRADGRYVKTTFSMIDMAGSERAAKTGGVRTSGLEAGLEAMKMMDAGTPEKLSIGAQGALINQELSLIHTEILKAADMHQKGLPYQAQKELSTAASFYFCACCDGRAHVGACVTVSQSPQHGFESWFSLQFAEQLAASRVPQRQIKPVPMADAQEAAVRAAQETAKKLAEWGTDPTPQGAKQWRVFALQQGAAVHAAETTVFLQKLTDARDGTDAGDADTDGSSDEECPEPAAPKLRQLTKRSALDTGKINDAFSVFIRVCPSRSRFPPLDREKAKGTTECFAVADVDFSRDPPPQRITVCTPEPASAASTSFVFDRVFGNAQGQEEVYRSAVQPYVAEVLGGTNVTIFAYGQTGTGKTHTIVGPKEDPGVVSRCVRDLLQGLPGTGKELYYEYVQLYLDEFKDLLLEEPDVELKLLDGGRSGPVLQNATRRRARHAEVVLDDLEKGAARRATRGHDLNEVSSRSHAILMLRLVDPGDDPAEAAASMFIVDLAGSERVTRSGVTGQGFDEATSINQSLTALGRVVVALLDNQCSGRNFVPYNASPLTRILRAGLGGNCKTGLIACVTQAADSVSESVNTLRFAAQATHVQNKVEKKEVADKMGVEREEIEGAGHSLILERGKGVVQLPTGPLEVCGHWDGASGSLDRVVILLTGLNAVPASLMGLSGTLAAKGCQVLVPKLPGTTEKDLESDVQALISLIDWLGLARPVLYGRDWGAIRACKFKLSHPKRAAHLVLEEHASKLGEKEYRAKMKKDPGGACFGYVQWMWFFDGAMPKSMESPPGKNMKGFKGNVDFLWPMCSKGRHDPQGRSGVTKMADMFARVVKTKAVDSYLMGDEELAELIASRLRC
ncbi:hypothetical protein CYMTET_43498 [Cymbomonas tetramitiformis]|uniref:Kinesin motor domain-containing protein n=1 Tax=Cymbomonas tetramitiformis TaxID=36881 RepID=A0AAE0C3B8_9CHLO|nr:hypothetical protein CYMTET_43498 [Cymbomonas tetramitiformis]|eukprot:gene10894-12889_t